LKINESISNRFRIVSAFSMIAVVWIHAKFIASRWQSVMEDESIISRLSAVIQYVFSENIGRLAVPLFFCISGFFYFQKYDGTLSVYVKGLKNKVFSILVPYVIWAGLWAMAYLFLDRAHEYSLFHIIDLFVFNPVPFQFWFLQALMIMILCSPIIFYGLKLGRHWVLIILAIAWFCQTDKLMGISGGLLFFSVGAWISQKKKIPQLTGRLSAILLLCYVLTLILNVVIYSLIPDQTWMLRIVLVKIEVLLGLSFVLLWIFSAGVSTNQPTLINVLKEQSGFVFFLYAMHEPLQSFLKTIWIAQLSFRSPSAILAAYLIIPLMTIALSFVVYHIINLRLPNFTRLLTGNRSSYGH
jgi:surface polysaccharide O-acyltransferase-like enzyme